MRLLLAAALLLALACAGPATAARPGLSPCRVAGYEALCGSLELWEDRAAQRGRRIGLKVVVLPAIGAEPLPDPIVLFAGGPGGAIIDQAAGIAHDFARLRAQRDLLLVDQRGTGGSHRLGCDLSNGRGALQEAFDELLPEAAVRACRATLEEKADLRLYTTSTAADDLAEVMDRLGYRTANLVGASYGTRIAQVFMRRHPERVRTATLAGVAAMDQHLPLFHARDAQRSLDLLLAGCAADPACAAAFPRNAEALAEVLARLEREPARVVAVHPDTGERGEVTIGRDAFAEALRTGLYVPGTAVGLPLAIHRARGGDYEPFVDATLPRLTATIDGLAMGMYLSVTCAEDLPFLTEEAVRRATAGTFLRDYRVRQQQRACALWPRGAIPPGFHEPVRSEAPTLLVSGALDPVTPPVWAERVAAALPRSLLVVVPHGHHQDRGLANQRCLDDVADTFIERGTVEGLDTSCFATMLRRGFTLPEPSPPAPLPSARPHPRERGAKRVGSEVALSGGPRVSGSAGDDGD